MPVKTFAKLEEVPADDRANAIETKAGTFLLVEDVDTTALEATVTEEKGKREAAEKLMRKTASELQKLQTARKAADAGLTEERLKEITDEANAQAEAKFKEQIEEAGKLKAQNRTLLLDANMKALALKAGILPEKVDDFWKLRGDEFDLTADGKPIVKASPTLKIEEHLAVLKKKNPEWVAGTKAAGSGALGGTGAGAAGAVSADEMLAHPERLIEAANAITT